MECRPSVGCEPGFTVRCINIPKERRVSAELQNPGNKDWAVDEAAASM